MNAFIKHSLTLLELFSTLSIILLVKIKDMISKRIEIINGFFLPGKNLRGQTQIEQEFISLLFFPVQKYLPSLNNNPSVI